MKTGLIFEKIKIWWRTRTEQCGFCNGNLQRKRKLYGGYGGVDIPVNISGSKKVTVYICNPCYYLHKKI